MNYRSIANMNDAIVRNLGRFPHDADLIIGIPRSGMMPANLLAMYLNKPFTSIEQFCNGVIYANGERKIDRGTIRKVLVVDDSICSGNQMRKAKEALQSYNIGKIFAAIYVKPENASVVDIYCEEVDMPRVFQWNIFNSKNAEKSMFCMDGVLCVDPKINDDSEQYIASIVNAKPLYIPKYTIDTIITCRPEKYRAITEKWLKKYDVTYKHLIMLPLNTNEGLQKVEKFGEWKAKHYADSKTILFIESYVSQAMVIKQITDKQVFCTETMKFV